MDLTIKINLDNATFEDDRSMEVGRMLTQVIRQQAAGWLCGTLSDSNGNIVGSWKIE